MTSCLTLLVLASGLIHFIASETLVHRERMRVIPAGQRRQDRRYVDQPWWTNNKIGGDPQPVQYQKLARANDVPSTSAVGDKPADFNNFLYGRDGKDGPMKHIMRILRILPPKDPVRYTDNGEPLPYVSAVPTPAPIPGRPSGLDRICSAGVEPLFSSGYYRYCDPRNGTNGCPNGYLCDYSLYITTHICCTERLATLSEKRSTLIPFSAYTTKPSSVLYNLTSEIPSSTVPTTQNETFQPWNETSTTATSTTGRWSPWSVWTEWISTSEPSSPSASWTETTELATNSWPSLPPYPEVVTNNVWPSLPPFEPNSMASILSNFPNPDIFPFQFTPSSGPFQTLWETTDAEIESQWTLFPGYTPPVWTAEPSVTKFPKVPGAHKSTTSYASLPPTVSSEPASKPTKTLPPIFPTPRILQISDVEVIPLTSGNIVTLSNGDLERSSTITLIRDGDKTILVDTGLPSDTNLLIRELSRHAIRPDNVDMVVITHGHPDHFGNQNLFSRKMQLFSSFEFSGNKFSRTSLAEHQFRKISPHVEIWKTPGHTPEDLTVIVRDVPSLGTVAVVGDLILNEDFLLNPNQWLNSGSWDRNVQQQNINTIVCMVDCIVPGHGPVFRLHEAHRKYSNCDQRLGNKYANYFG